MFLGQIVTKFCFSSDSGNCSFLLCVHFPRYLCVREAGLAVKYVSFLCIAVRLDCNSFKMKIELTTSSVVLILVSFTYNQMYASLNSVRMFQFISLSREGINNVVRLQSSGM